MANFTERMIIETFMKLLEERSFDKITVKDIISETGISRNTFYYHFQDVYDLARKVADKEFERIFELDFNDQSWKEVLRVATYEAEKSKRQLYHIVGKLDRKSLETYLYRIAYKIVEMYTEETIPDLECDEELKQFVYKIYASALLGITIRWIDDGMPDEADYIFKASDVFTGTIANTFKKLQSI